MMTMTAERTTELNAISEKLVGRLDELLDHFHIEYQKHHNRYSFACPLHGGDNITALNIFVSGSKIVGNWKCFTHQCDEVYGKGILGFLKGMLSVQNGREVHFGEAVKWADSFVGGVILEAGEPTVNYDDFITITNCINKNNAALTGELTREEFRKQIVIPPEYYLNRGYKAVTMDQFDIGLCLDKTHRFFTRIVVPIYDEMGKRVIGSVARTTQPLCQICNKYHFANRPCPQNDIERIWSEKWLNSTGFRKASYLYNFWNAKEHIRNTGKAILVEGQGDVWRLVEAGIHNGLGMFGCELSDEQMILLEKSGAMELWVLTDNDEAGIKARAKISAKCARLYNLKFLNLPDKDIGETPVEEVKRLFHVSL